MKKKMVSILVLLAIAAWVIVPEWYDVYRIRVAAKDFMNQAEMRGIDVKVISATHYLTNPFTWFSPVPTFIVARKEIDKGDYLMLYFRAHVNDSPYSFSASSVFMDKALIWADCENHVYRLVDRQSYGEIQYDVLGRKLPKWEDASIQDMIAARISIPLSKDWRQHLLYKAACEWDNSSL